MLSVLKENMLQLMKKMGNQSRDIHNIKETIAHFKTKRNKMKTIYTKIDIPTLSFKTSFYTSFCSSYKINACCL